MTLGESITEIIINFTNVTLTNLLSDTGNPLIQKVLIMLGIISILTSATGFLFNGVITSTVQIYAVGKWIYMKIKGREI